MTMTPESPVDQPDTEAIKQVHRRFVTGVTVVTTMSDATPRGLAVNAFSSISLDPPLILVCVQKTSSTHKPLFGSTHLAVNILSADQVGVASTFASKQADKFAHLDWAQGPHGSPILTKSAGSLEGEICERLETATHTVFICRVTSAEARDVDPLVYSAGDFYHGGHLPPVS